MRVVLIFNHLSNVNSLHPPQLNLYIKGYHLFWKFEVSYSKLMTTGFATQEIFHATIDLSFTICLHYALCYYWVTSSWKWSNESPLWRKAWVLHELHQLAAYLHLATHIMFFSSHICRVSSGTVGHGIVVTHEMWVAQTWPWRSAGEGTRWG